MGFESSTLLRTGVRWLKRRTRPLLALRRNKKRSWEANWSREGYAPLWETTTIPNDVRDAVDSGWFEPGAAVLDIGCGSGEISAWLAEQGFHVLGLDFSGPGIDLAKSRHLEAPGSLEFKVADICGEAAPPAGFNALLDHGCFHGIPRGFRSSYMRNIASCSVPGAKMLLFARLKNMSPRERIRDVERAFQPVFEISRTAEIHKGEHPGVAFWMVRQ